MRGEYLLSEFEQKVLKLLEAIDNKVDKLISSEISKRRAEVSTSARTTTNIPAAAVEKQEKDDQQEEKPHVEGRRVCTSCGGTTFNTVEDRTQILHSMGGVKIYAKKHICKTCGEVSEK